MEDTNKEDEVVSNDDKDAYKAYCLKESDEAYTTAIKSQEEYDKQLLLLSTGLLGILVAFLKDVVHLGSAVRMPLLYCGFTMLGLTIILVISSFQFSVFALERAREYFNQRYNGNLAFPFPEGLSNLVRAVNIAGGICFFAGVVLVFSFLAINLAHQNNGEPYEDNANSGGISSKESDRSVRGTAWNAGKSPIILAPKASIAVTSTPEPKK